MTCLFLVGPLVCFAGVLSVSCVFLVCSLPVPGICLACVLSVVCLPLVCSLSVSCLFSRVYCPFLVSFLSVSCLSLVGVGAPPVCVCVCVCVCVLHGLPGLFASSLFGLVC